MSGQSWRVSLARLSARPQVVAAQLVVVLIGVTLFSVGLGTSAHAAGVVVLTPALLLASALHESAVLTIAQRWRCFLKGLSIDIAWWQAWRITLEGNFYFLVVPFGLGLDAARTAKLLALRSEATMAQSLVPTMADRAAGLASMLLLALPYMAWPLLAPTERLTESQRDLTLTWLLAAAAIVGIGLAFLLRQLLRTNRIADWISGKLRRFGLGSWQGMIETLPSVMMLSITSLLLMAGGVYVLATAWGISITYPTVVFALCASLAAQVIPISLLGVSAAEAAGVAVYVAMGYSTTEALAIVFALYLLRTISGLLGGTLEFLRTAVGQGRRFGRG